METLLRRQKSRIFSTFFMSVKLRG